MERRHCENPLCTRIKGCALAQLVEGQLSVTNEKVGGVLEPDNRLSPQAARMIEGQEKMLRACQADPNEPLHCIYPPSVREDAFVRIAQMLTVLAQK